MTPETAAVLQQLQSSLGITVAIVGLVGSAIGTVIGTKVGQWWLTKSLDHLRGWVHDLDGQVTNHETRISKVEGVCEERRKAPQQC